MQLVTKISNAVMNMTPEQDIYEDVVLRCISEAPTIDAVALPCQVGGIVYRITEGNYHSDYKPFIKPMTVTEISWKKTRSDKDLGFAIIADGIRYRFSSIGKSVFLTLEDAEAYAATNKQK